MLRVVVVGLALLVAAGPALGRTVRAELIRVVEQGVSGSVTYDETNHGRDVGQTTLGVVGKGTIGGKLSLGAKLAATLLGAVKGVPAADIAAGGSYVTRFDIDAKGDHKGLVVISFAKPGLGKLCASFDAAYGKFVPGKADYVPSTTTVTTLGGTGKLAAAHATLRVTQGEVTGGTIERILGSGPVLSLSRGAAAPLSKECLAVAALGTG